MKIVSESAESGIGKLARKTTRRSCVVALALIVGGCASSSVSVSQSNALSTDPVLSSVIGSFEAGCIDNAPHFDPTRMRSGFDANQPELAQGMLFLASGKPGQSCGVTVRGYGQGRPTPTIGDLNRLGRKFAAKTGGTLRPAVAGQSQRVEVKSGRKSFDISGYVTSGGDLRFNVYE
ncbi:hypothetical protein RUE5091_00190 [Ruegeria denitrificans]|uniref:Lipoprotein n=1 Tax=Ruegeria denitrificans TaxID=1715692 RepID=A0A0P1I197_9RHOB|nr:hypothetical protein [Ruegeria denitrificans]CUJ84174.1 hypothetical protein RUE5091_00190 [Ruegeria denitrificans]